MGSDEAVRGSCEDVSRRPVESLAFVREGAAGWRECRRAQGVCEARAWSLV